MKKHFDLYVHGKQGDDLGHLLDMEGATPSKAFIEWAGQMRRNADLLEKLAGLSVEVTNADGNFISISALDSKSATALKKLLT